MVVLLGQTARQLPKSLGFLCIGLCFDNVSDAFGLGQIDLARFKGASRELTRLSQAHSRLTRQCTDCMGYDGWTAMQVKLQRIFTGIGMRPGHEDDESLINEISILVAKFRQSSMTGFRQAAIEQGTCQFPDPVS